MLNFKDIDWKKGGIFAAGVLFGTAGIKALSSDDAKNVYTSCTAAVLRAKSCVMKTVAVIQENAEISTPAQSRSTRSARQPQRQQS